jgi:mannose-6-phosphate isomerase
MSLSLTQPLIFEPIYQERVWGGRAMETVLGRKLPAGKCIGEAWEIVDRPEAQSVVRDGPIRGKTLHDLWSQHRAEIFGCDLPETTRFPILAKLLDAREKLSLQVHPGPRAAQSLGGESKTEMWYFLATEADAEIYAGLRHAVTQDDFREAIENGQAADVIHRIKVAAGDVFFVPSGRLHAIGRGSLLVEIQENSDTTYRVYDWDRSDAEGKPRELHLAESIQSIDFDDFEPGLVRPKGEQLISCPHFVIEKWQLTKPRAVSTESAFALFVCLEGALEAAGLPIAPGQFFLVPKSSAAMELKPSAPETALLRITLPRESAH